MNYALRLLPLLTFVLFVFITYLVSSNVTYVITLPGNLQTIKSDFPAFIKDSGQIASEVVGELLVLESKRKLLEARQAADNDFNLELEYLRAGTIKRSEAITESMIKRQQGQYHQDGYYGRIPPNTSITIASNEENTELWAIVNLEESSESVMFVIDGQMYFGKLDMNIKKPVLGIARNLARESFVGFDKNQSSYALVRIINTNLDLGTTTKKFMAYKAKTY